MEFRQTEKSQVTEGVPEAQQPRERRLRIVKLEERIAPSQGKGHPGGMSHRGDCYYYTITCHW